MNDWKAFAGVIACVLAVGLTIAAYQHDATIKRLEISVHDLENEVRLLQSTGKRVSSLEPNDGNLRVSFEDGSSIKLLDVGKPESSSLRECVGATLLSAELREPPKSMDVPGVHNLRVLMIRTDRGDLALDAH
jgi:hypothetical protein